jgi:hypothetical protein
MGLFGDLFKKKQPVENPAEEKETQERRKSVSIRYSYEWKEDVPLNERDTPDYPSRPFCAKLMALNRLYSRREIELISQRLGYSVFDRCGGDDCRHYWKSNFVVKESDL